MIPGALAAWWMIAPAAAAPPAMAAPAAAAESMRVVRLPEIEIRAERVAAAVLLPFRTATFSREEIERRPEAHLADLLEIVAGVRVASRGLGSSSVSIRGSTTDQVIVVRDGRRISPAQGGGAPVTVYTAPNPAPFVNLAQLDDLADLLGDVEVPAGTYTGAVVTIDAGLSARAQAF